jgi:hypothetical protein
MRSSDSTVERPALWWVWLAVLSPAEQAALGYKLCCQHGLDH